MHRSRLLGPLAGLLLLSGCSSLGIGDDPLGIGSIDVGNPLDSVGSSLGLGGASSATSSPAGVAVGDEPFAVAAGASLLSQGGSAADAAAAIYFALSVTYPVAAGLGGGGICIVHDPASGRTEEFDFLPRNASGGGAYAVPGAVKGFADLQAAYGTLPWQRDVAPAEGFAGSGFPVSRALAQRLAESQNEIRLDAALAKEFLDESGQVKQAGAIVSNPAIASTLAAIRTQGPAGFYIGPVGAGIVAYSSAQGGAISAAELGSTVALRHPAREVTVAGQTAYLPGLNTGAGAFADAVLRNLQTSGNDAADVVEAERRALASFGINGLPKDLGSTGFAAVDAHGQAVGCAVTMNGPFGSGHSAGDSGIVLARAPSSGPAGMAGAFLTPFTTNEGMGGPVVMAGAGAGGPNSTAAMAFALLRSAHSSALLGPGDLRSTGAAPYETINAVDCRGGVCVALNDPGANGLGTAAETLSDK